MEILVHWEEDMVEGIEGIKGIEGIEGIVGMAGKEDARALLYSGRLFRINCSAVNCPLHLPWTHWLTPYAQHALDPFRLHNTICCRW